jgi:hypothetical protein
MAELAIVGQLVNLCTNFLGLMPESLAGCGKCSMLMVFSSFGRARDVLLSSMMCASRRIETLPSEARIGWR